MREGGFFLRQQSPRLLNCAVSNTKSRDVLCQLWGHCGALLTPHLTHGHWQDNAVTWNSITEFLTGIWRAHFMPALVSTEHVSHCGGHILSQPLDTSGCSEMSRKKQGQRENSNGVSTLRAPSSSPGAWPEPREAGTGTGCQCWPSTRGAGTAPTLRGCWVWGCPGDG